MDKNNSIYLGLVINQLEGRYQKQIISGVKQWAMKENIGIIVISGKSLNSPYPGENKYNSIYQTLQSPILDGLIIASGSIGSFLTADETADFFKQFKNIPKISLGMQLGKNPWVGGNNSKGIKDALEHLILEHNYSKIAFLGGPESNKDAKERLTTFYETMDCLGCNINKDLVFKGDFTFFSSLTVVDMIKNRGEIPFDAILCANDEMALGLINNLDKMGYICPRDYSIIGFDDIEDSSFTTPTLTTISQSLFYQAQKSGELLLEMVKGNKVPIKTEVESNLVIRESCGCISYSSKQKSESYFTMFGIQIQNILNTLKQTLAMDIRIRRQEPIFLQLLDESLEMTMDIENYTIVWNSVLEYILDTIPGKLRESIQDISYINSIFLKGFAVLTKRNGQREALRYNRIEGILLRFRSISDKIIPSLSIEKVWSVLEEEISLLDIKFLYIGLNSNHGTDNDDFYKLKPVFLYNKKRIELPDELYTANLIFPESISKSQLPKGIIVQPLIKHDNLFGIIAIERRDMESIVYDTLTDIIAQIFYTFNFYKKRTNTENILNNKIAVLTNDNSQNKLYLEHCPIVIVETNTDLSINNIYANSNLGLTNIDKNIGGKIKVLRNMDPVNFSSELLGELNHRTNINIPQFTLVLPDKGQSYPVIRYSKGSIDNITSKCTSIIWYAFSPDLPFYNEVLPTKEFYNNYNITEREQEIIGLLLFGKRSKDISEQLFLAESTVKGHIGQIYSKFEVKGRHEMLELIKQHKLLTTGKNVYILSLINDLLKN